MWQAPPATLSSTSIVSELKLLQLTEETIEMIINETLGDKGPIVSVLLVGQPLEIQRYYDNLISGASVVNNARQHQKDITDCIVRCGHKEKGLKKDRERLLHGERLSLELATIRLRKEDNTNLIEDVSDFVERIVRPAERRMGEELRHRADFHLLSPSEFEPTSNGL